MFELSKEEKERAFTLHRKTIVVDTHNDTILDIMRGPPSFEREFSLVRTLDERSEVMAGVRGRQIDLPRIKEGGVDCLIFAMCVSRPIYRGRRLRRLLQMLDIFYSEIEKNSDEIALTTTEQEVRETVKMGKVAALLSIEGGEVFERDIGALRMLYKLGVRSVGLTHFPRNELGDGAGRGDSGSHLTEFGEKVVEEMNRLGMIVDISHINETGFWDVMEKTNSPVITSHSNCRALCDHYRNLNDKQIEAIAKSGGVVNLSFVGDFTKAGVKVNQLTRYTDEVRIEDWIKHVDHIVDLVGVDHIGLGSDWDGGCGFPGLKDIADVPNITLGLVAQGYSDEDIEKILGGNNLRVFRDVLK